MQRPDLTVPRFACGPHPGAMPGPARAPLAPAARGGRAVSLPALFPLPFLHGLSETLVLQASVVLLGLAFVAALMLAVSHWRALIRARRALAGERARADHQGAVLAAARAGFWSWPAGPGGPGSGTGSGMDGGPGQGGGGLAMLLGVSGTGLGGFADVLALLRRADAAALGEAVDRLRGEGGGFSLRVETADGRRTLQVRGLRTAATPGAPEADVVWFRDITDAVREAARLMERVNSLTAQNAQLRQVLDGLAVPVWVRGPDLAIVYCNRAYARAVEEAAPAAAIAAGKEIASGPAGWGRRLAEEAQGAGEPRSGTLHVVVDGARRLFEICEFPVGGEGNAWRVAGVAVDRTDTDLASAELARHVAAHAEVLEKLGTGIVIYGPDTRVQFFNAAYARMWAFDVNWLRGGPTHGEVLEDLRARRMYPEQSDFQDFKRRRIDLYTSLMDPQEELLHLPDERVIRLVISPHPLGGLMFIAEDVTDRLTLERSYNTLIAVQSETLNNLHEGVAVYGSDGRLKLHNPAFARIWKLDPDLLDGEPRMAEVLDASKDLFLHDGSWEDFRDLLISQAADRTARAGRFERGDGSILDYAAVPLPDGAMLFTYIDVTDSVAVHRALRERNEALLTADRLKSEFITNVSYELRTPLNTIIGFTEILSNQYFGTLNRRQAEYARGTLEASHQLLALIDDILDLALIESGQLELDVAPTDIQAMLDSVAALARERARKSGLALALECREDIGTFTMDEKRIKQALFNLVSNAIKHTPPEGRITIAARRRSRDLEIAVTDTGTGIPAGDRARVFEKFERGDEGHGGVGLGLALVKSFVDMHGGRVALESELGRGTTVRMVLPAAPAAGTGAAENPPPWSDPGAGI